MHTYVYIYIYILTYTSLYISMYVDTISSQTPVLLGTSLGGRLKSPGPGAQESGAGMARFQDGMGLRLPGAWKRRAMYSLE